MTSRDLLQQRTTLENGDTTWRPSPLIDAMEHGHIAVLDGLHRINGGTFSVLARYVLYFRVISSCQTEHVCHWLLLTYDSNRTAITHLAQTCLTLLNERSSSPCKV